MDLPDLKTVISSAEPCTDAVVEKWGRDGRRFMNLYGNSEISIGSTLYEYKEKGQKLTIGKPFPNTQMYLLDHELQQVPEGVIAEIYTGGVGLARGYLNRPDATAEKFIPNPFTLVPGERLYRTGDLGRYLPNGEIEFLGREDFQVSIRGFRIELTEIEDVLRENEAIGEVAVVARPDPQGMDRLICYTVPREKGKELDVAMLRKILGDRLPNYMVPSLFVQLDSMPLTPNRKVDRLGLPEPDMTFLIEKRFVEPKTAEEKQLAQIWCDVMGLDRVGITNDFFEIGGHSLLATQIVSRINETLNRNVSIKAFFEHSTIEKLAHLISEGHQTQESGPIDILSDRQAVPLSFAQQRMWFLDQYEEHSTFYNMPGLYHLEGPLDQDALEMAFQRLIERHEVLRTNYVVLEGQPVQKIHPRMNWLLERNVLGGESEEEKRAELWKKVHEQMQHRFSLSEDRLMRAALYSFTVTHHYLFVTLHHILADGWSMKVMITDLAELYSAAVQKREANLPPLSVQYADYAAWQARILAEGRMEAQRHFWVRELHGTADIPLPIDFVRPEKQTFNGERLAIEFSSEMSERIAQLSRRYRTTPYITMLTAFAILLGRFCEHSDICLGTPIANRTRKELESLIGFFANTLVLRIRPETGMTFESVLEQVKKTAVDAYAHQDIPFDQVVEAVQPVRDASRNPLFQVFFSLNEWPQSSYEMEKVALKVVELEDKTAKFDLYLMVYTGPERMSGFFEYNTDLFRADTIRSLFSALNSVLEQIVDRPDGRIEALALSDGTAFASESEAKFSDYPVLEALYGPRLDSERFHFSVVDASMSPVPMGATGYVQLWGSVESDAILTSFKARMRNGKLYLIRSDEGVIWVDNQLLYPSEVEAFLLEQPTIADCHVILSQDNLGQAVLVAFLVLNTVSGRLDRVYLAEQIRARVKVAHLRVACVRIGHIPLAASGKVDETALLALPVLTETEIAAISDQARPLLQDQADLYVGFFPLSFQQSRIHLDELFGRQLDQGGLTVDGSIMERESVTDNATVFRKEALAYANGGELILPERAPRTLTEAFLAVARECPESGMSFYRPDGTLMFVSYPELLQRAQKIVAGLQARGFQPGEAAILQIDDLMHYFPVYWGCVLAGVRPVTVAVAHEYERGNNVVEKLHGIWSLLDKPPIIASTAVIKRVEQLFIRYPMEGGQVIDLATLSTHGISEAYYPATEDDIIFYQLSSGSTGVSKCIQERHGGIVRHIHAGAQYNGYGPKDVTLNWLPMDHVVPILTCHLKDTYWGCHQILVPTDAILGDPLVWLDLIDQCRVNYTWAPNFAFKLVSEAIRKHSDRQWDLSSIRFFMNAGEQVTMPVVREFLDMTSPFGVHQQTMQPAFGMAEVCTCMTYRNGFDVSTGARFFDKRTLSGYMQPVSVSDENAIGFIDLGGPVRGVEIRITDSENQPVAEGVIGRFQIRGGVVTPGYLRNEEANQEAFVGEGWFNSGDLGFIWEGHLFLTGREKEQIVVNGANFYCYEIEDVVNSVEGVKPTYSAACSVYDERTGTEKLAVFFVPANEDVTLNPQQIELIAAVRGQVTRNLGIFPQIVLPLTLSDFPKTTSGKIQRNTLRKGLLNGAFDRTLMDIDLQAGASNTLPLWFYRPNWVPKVIKRSGQLDRHGGILLFCESSDRAHHLVARLQSEKIALRLVRPNDNFSQHGGEYGIRPDRAEDYRQLKWHLEKEGFHCTHIVHDWSVRHGTSLNFELAQQEGLFSLLRILQTFQEAEHDTRLDVRVVTQYAYSIDQEDSVGYVNATLPGFAASVGSEAMGLGAAVIDIGEMNAQLAAEAIFQEICSIEMEDAVYRRGKRYVMRIQPCFTRETLLETPVQIQKNGRYVISGGLGGVSIELTRFLLTRFSARVLLLDCIDLENHPEKRILLKELASLSGQVVYENVDITCLERVESAVTRFSEQMGASVNGVFHLAGQYYERLFQDEAVDSLQEMLRAKCLGAIALDAVMAKQPPSDEAPLFFNMSSVLARFGGPGLGSYSSANSFLCSFTRHQNRSDRLGAAVRSTCFVSSNWNETGMRRDYKNKAVANDLGFLFMSPEHGVASMLAVIGQEHEEVWVGLNAHKPGVRPLCSEDLALDQVCVVTTGTVPLPPIDGQDALGKFYRTHCALVETIPLKRTGEVDLDTLQAQLTGQQRLRQTVVLPRNPLERDIADICTEVLHLDEISVKDNLFDLGGNSLLITKIHHQLQTRLGMRFPLVEMFNSPSVEKLAANLTFSNETGLPALVKISRETPVPMSYSQQRLWFIDKLGSDGALFAMPLVLRVVGELNRAALEETINRLVMRHETLRTTFSEREGELLQIIHENAPIQVPCHTVRSLVEGMGKEQADTALRKRVMDEIKLPFDLSQGPLIRLSVFELGNHEHVLVFNMHHIISDGWSLGIVAREFVRGYTALISRSSYTPEPLEKQYADYAVWQRAWLASPSGQAHLNYWIETLSGLPPVLELPLDFARPAQLSHLGEQINVRIDADLTRALEALAAHSNGTLFMVLMAAFNVVLYRWSGKKDLPVGSGIASRLHSELDSVIGFFADVWVLRTRINEEETFVELLERTRIAALEAYEHQSIPFDMIVDALHPERSLNYSPIYQVMFVLHNTPHAQLDVPGLKIEPVQFDTGTSKHDISVNLWPDGNELSGWIEYSTEVFQKETIQRLFDRYVALLGSVIETPNKGITQLELGDQEEMERLRHRMATPAEVLDEEALLSLSEDELSAMLEDFLEE
jgi:non-ribosomal peptide synthetase component F/short-subunit dehydrogenase/acyl carrier protein